MKQISCEMCGSTDLVKEDGFFVCQSCGIKYSLEEARKLMTGETVEVEGTVKIDSSDELSNLYLLARRARETNKFKDAIEYYEQILLKDANSWEALFYRDYCKERRYIHVSLTDLTNDLKHVLESIKNYVPMEKQESTIVEVSSVIFNLSASIAEAYNFKNLPLISSKSDIQNRINNLGRAENMLYTFGDNLIEVFGDEYGSIAASSWIVGNEITQIFIPKIKEKKKFKGIVNSYAEKIQKYDDTYETPYKKRSLSDMKKSLENKKDSIEDKKKFFGR